MLKKINNLMGGNVLTKNMKKHHHLSLKIISDNLASFKVFNFNTNF